MAGGRSLGTLTLDVIAKIGGLATGMSQAERLTEKGARAMERRLQSLRKNAEVVGQGIGLAIAAGAGILAHGIKSAIDEADHLNDLNQRLGISAEALSGWAYVAKQTGTDIDGLAIGLKKLSKNIAEAVDSGSGSGKLFAALDISPIDQATGKLRDLESILPQIADKFKNLHDETLEAALAEKLFGKQGTDLIEFLNLGSEGVDKLREKLRDMGGELSQDTLSAADEFNDTLGDMRTEADSLFRQLAADLLPDLIKLAEYFRDNYTEGDKLKETAHEIAQGIRYLAIAADGAVKSVQAMTSVVLASYNALAGLAKLNPGAFLANLAQGGTGIGEHFAAAKREFDAVNGLHDDFMGRFGAHPAGSSSYVPGSASGPRNARGRPHTGGDDQAALMKLLANETEHKAKADHSAADAARRHAKALEELQREVEAVAEANKDFTTNAEDMRAELEGPLAQAALNYKRDLADLRELAEKGEVGTQALKSAEADLAAQYAKTTAEIKDRLDTGKRVLEDLQFQIDLTNMATQAERDHAQFLHDNLTATKEQADAFDRMNAQLVESRQAIDAADNFRGHWEDAFASILDGSKSVKDAFNDLASSILADIARMLAHKWVEQLFGQFGTSGGGGGFFSSLLGAFTGGGSSSSSGDLDFNTFGFGGLPPTGFANGTDFAPGGMAWVGERGRELVNLPRGSQVIPNHRLGSAGGGFNQNNNFYLAAPTDPRTQQQIAAKTAFETRRAMARNA